MITVGFTLIGRGAWSGGETYQRNMLGVMARELAGRVSARLFLTPEQHARIGGALDRFLTQPAIVDERVRGAGEGRRAIEALLTGRDAAFAGLIAEHPVDVMFQSAQWLGERFPVPLVSWIPDFQHRHLPQLFSKAAWWRRDIGFRLQTGSRQVVMLSSEDARTDCERFYPHSRGKIGVVPFAIDLDPGPVMARAEAVRAAYGLPPRFFYLPNQFWSHKNHGVVVAALNRLATAGQLDAVLPVILTGRRDDPRDPGLYDRTLTEVSAHGLERHFRHLGLIPYEDVFALIAAADHLINPSLFEGWSTPVEEAKALGAPMILSSLGVHHEQAPDAVFFGPDDPQALADLLLRLSQAPPGTRPPVDLLTDRQAQRHRDYAAALLAVFEMALRGRR